MNQISRSKLVELLVNIKLSTATQEMYRLVAPVAVDLVKESDAHFDESIAEAKAVCVVDRFIWETTSDSRMIRQDLSRITEDTRLFQSPKQDAQTAGSRLQTYSFSR